MEPMPYMYPQSMHTDVDFMQTRITRWELFMCGAVTIEAIARSVPSTT